VYIIKRSTAYALISSFVEKMGREEEQKIPLMITV
jgi:hypothetical protein